MRTRTEALSAVAFALLCTYLVNTGAIMHGLESSSENVQRNPNTEAPRASVVQPAQVQQTRSTDIPPQRRSTDSAVLLQNARVLIQHKEYSLAMNLLRTVLMREQNDLQGLKWMGICFKETGKLSEAEKCFRALYVRSENADDLYLLAETLYLNGNDGEAKNAYLDVLSDTNLTDARRFEACKNLGNIYVRAGDYDAADEAYNKAYTIHSSSDALMVNYGTLEIQRENLEAAVERFRRAVQLNESNDRGWVGLALVHRHMGDFELSRANIERALDINPRNKTALKLLVEWDLADRDLSSSTERLKLYMSLEGEDAEMGFILAKIFMHTSRISEAVLEMERVFNLDPSIEGGLQLMTLLHLEKAKRILLK